MNLCNRCAVSIGANNRRQSSLGCASTVTTRRSAHRGERRLYANRRESCPMESVALQPRSARLNHPCERVFIDEKTVPKLWAENAPRADGRTCNRESHRTLPVLRNSTLHIEQPTALSNTLSSTTGLDQQVAQP